MCSHRILQNWWWGCFSADMLNLGCAYLLEFIMIAAFQLFLGRSDTGSMTRQRWKNVHVQVYHGIFIIICLHSFIDRFYSLDVGFFMDLCPGKQGERWAPKPACGLKKGFRICFSPQLLTPPLIGDLLKRPQTEHVNWLLCCWETAFLDQPSLW